MASKYEKDENDNERNEDFDFEVQEEDEVCEVCKVKKEEFNFGGHVYHECPVCGR